METDMKKKILVAGAGRSATAAIRYLLDVAQQKGWEVIVADANLALARKKVADAPAGRAEQFDITNPEARARLVGEADVVVSLLPPHLHLLIARECLKQGKHLVTASYVSTEMYALSEEVRLANLVFMNEIGLDPGIDHMSAVRKIHQIKARGGKLTAFRSYTGGLVAPECADNPWRYKFTWNPRNVVLAGKGTAQFLEDGRYRYVPYHRLFRHTRKIEVEGLGPFEVYPNRDSLLYRQAYGLEDIPNLFRGTIRYPGFCESWHALVTLGLTDDSYPILESDRLTWRQLMDGYVSSLMEGDSTEEKVARLLGTSIDSPLMDRLRWLGLFEPKPITRAQATPARLLEDLLLEKWALQPEDRDMVVMQHEFEYVRDSKRWLEKSTLVMKGRNAEDTAMTRLVGLPLAIFTRLLLEGKISQAGVQIPIRPEVYEPVLGELEAMGVKFVEEKHPLP